jgi:hypothetical protein
MRLGGLPPPDQDVADLVAAGVATVNAQLERLRECLAREPQEAAGGTTCGK